MKAICAAAFALFLLTFATLAQENPAVVIPEKLKGKFEVLSKTYPKMEALKKPKEPADSAWIFRSQNSAVGTVEVGFEGESISYMIFRRGVGGAAWTKAEIKAIHISYHKNLLHERYVAEKDFFSAYAHDLLPSINAAVIKKKFGKFDKLDSAL